jgi:hypothetical protein
MEKITAIKQIRLKLGLTQVQVSSMLGAKANYKPKPKAKHKPKQGLKKATKIKNPAQYM